MGMFDDVNVSANQPSARLKETIRGLRLYRLHPYSDGAGVEISSRDQQQYDAIFAERDSKLAEAEANLALCIDREQGVVLASDLAALSE